jgi:hypothetical protein
MIEEIREIVGIGGVHHFTRTREAWLFFAKIRLWKLQLVLSFSQVGSGD